MPTSWRRSSGGAVAADSEVKVSQRPHDQPQAAHHVDGLCEPAFARQQRDGGHRDGNLQRGRGLSPAVMLVHQGFARLVEPNRFGLELLGGELDRNFLGLVALRFRVEIRLARSVGKPQAELAQMLLVAAGLIEIPLVECLDLFDGGIVFSRAASAWVAPAMYENTAPTVASRAVITANWPAMPRGARSTASSSRSS